jgi:hypothetical protein
MKTNRVQGIVTALARKSKRLDLPAEMLTMPARVSEGGDTKNRAKNCAMAWRRNAPRGTRGIQIMMDLPMKG